MLLALRTPVPTLGRHDDKHLALRMRRDVGERQVALAFLRAALTQRQEAAEAAVGFPVLRIADEAQAILEIETGADDEAKARLLGRHVRAHDAGERIAVGEAEPREAESFRLSHEFVRVRAPAQEREIRDHLQLGIGGPRP